MFKLAHLAVFTTTLALAACGGSGSGSSGVGSKDGAARAAGKLEKTGDELHSRRGQGLSPSQLQDVEQRFEVTGQSGKAIITQKVGVGTGDVSVEYSIQYQGYSGDGLTTYDGQITHRVHVAGSGGAGEVSTELVGEVVMTGETSGHLKLDVSVKVVSDASGGRVELNGTIDGDGTRYTYAGEAFDLSID